MKKYTIRKLRKFQQAFCGVRTVLDLAKLLKTEAQLLESLVAQPLYYSFTVPKKDGTDRWIENPAKPLKKTQRRLNKYLQAVTYGTRTTAAYGFMPVAKYDPDPRHILTNAKRHLGCHYLFNADIEDFFHQVKFEMVNQLFLAAPFCFPEIVSELLSNLVTHQGRLPMGAPTSPAISNLICINMDKELLQLSKKHQLNYTRYADDLSFSSQQEILETQIESIVGIVAGHGFSFNPEKIKKYEPEEEKEVTGLIVGKSIRIPDSFINTLNDELQKLANVIEVQQRTGGHSTWVNIYKKYLEGKMAFVNQIMGADHALTTKLLNTYDTAIHPPDQFESVKWLDFPYR